MYKLRSLKLKHSDLPDDYFEPDIEHYATWLGTAAIGKWVPTVHSEHQRLLARISDKGREYTTQADISGGKLKDSTCSCGKYKCAHLALVLMTHAALERERAAPPSVPRSNPAQQKRNNKTPKNNSSIEQVPPRLRGWLNQAEQVLGKDSKGREQQTLAFILSTVRHKGHPTLAVHVRRAEWYGDELHLLQSFRLPYSLRYDTDSIRDLPDYARRDLSTLRLLITSAQSAVIEGEEGYYLGESGLSSLLLSSLLETGRLLWRGTRQPLRQGPPLSAQMTWHTDPEGMQRLLYQPPTGVERLPINPAWYLKDERELGKLQSSLSPAAEEVLLNLPAVRPEESSQFGEAVQKMFGAVVPPPTPITVREEELPYRPLLRLSHRAPALKRKSGWGTPRSDTRPQAELLHLYGEQTPPPLGHKPPTEHAARHYQNGELFILRRDPAAERKATNLVARQGFQKLSKHIPPALRLDSQENPHLLTLETESEWFSFIENGAAQLEAAGIRVEIPEDFPYRLAFIEDWYGETNEAGGWFTLDLGVVVDGQKVSLLPILVSLIASRPDLFSPTALAALDDQETLYAALPDGRKLPLPAGRVRNIISILVELNLRELPAGPLTMPLLDAIRLAQLDEALKARWVGAERLLALGRKLRDFAGIQPAQPPKNLQADLRPYQEQGLSWLQFLRETEMGGILADDMGLGKAQPLDAPVLTPLGWRTMGELQVGDFVIGQRGQPTQITGVFPQGLRPIYRVTLTDGSSVEVDNDHLWAVQTPVQKRRGQGWRILTTKQLRADLTDAAGNLKHYLPMVEPVQFAAQNLPIDPYTLGALLGDGCLIHNVSITSEDELVAALPLPAGVEARHAEALTSKVSTYRLVTAGHWSANPLKDALRELGLHGKNGHTKFVPSPYLLGSAQQRLALLQGLLDSDGHAGAVVEYTSVSEALARAVVELTQSLGGTAQIRQKATSHTYRGEHKTGQAWRVTLKLPPQLDPFRLPEKLAAYRRPSKYPPTRGIRRIDFVGYKPAQCIAVAASDHLYVTEGYIVTHNTLQTLAHIQLEKEAGRAELPSLVVAPTSVLHNWKREAARFTPKLKVLTLHGPERKNHFAELHQYDLVLTSYPLLPRDLSELEKQPYHLLILDEAQNIKNAKSASAKAAGGLKANHRLALTGTPLENHLGELWSLFNFLSPGLLHSEKMFRELYRTPIEKHADPLRRAALAARIRPFVLRREKTEVARELPPKTEIPVRVTLEGDQRDLYETVRVTMQERVREELSARGLARSTIAILDALLKLRQAVTDPRLVKLEAAHSVTHNAKLDWFTENVPKLVEDGRRILVFSAFATLLGHLEEPLKRLGIPYSKLTGQTKHREPQIAAFQNGETKVFLISLKAGGVGLNLTAADTVIHYDPWWNPAAENQATDRAYRIGQERPVFVYKLLAAGSVEERILEMQQRKAALAKGVLDGGLSDASQLTQRDLDNLFAPLADEEE